MDTLPATGLVLALIGPPAVLVAVRLCGGEPFRLWSALVMWGIACVATVVAMVSYDDWPAKLGLHWSGWHTAAAALTAAILLLASWPAVQFLQRALGGSDTTDSESFKKIAAKPIWHRLFLVTTAGVVEEVLYRGYGIGVGQLVFGSTSLAVVISLGIFVAAYFRWGLSHLLSVTWAGAVLSALFVITNSLLACIIVHALVDAVGFLLVPAVRARKSKHATVMPGEV